MESLSNAREITRDLIWSPHPSFTEKDYPSLKGKVYIVTGASAGIGLGTAKLLVAQGAKVYITGRTPTKIKEAIKEINAAGKGVGSAEVLPIYHEDFASIQLGCAQFLAHESRLDGIVHNAGINYRGQNVVEPYGLLDIIVINVLSGQLIQNLLIKVLEATPGSRTVWLSSAIHYHSPPCGGIEWDDMNNYDSGGYLGKGNGMYGQTKAMNFYQAVQWGRRHPKVISVACHPGNINTDIRRSNRWRKMVLGSISRPCIWGAYQVVQLLLDPKITTSDNGSYYVPFGLKTRTRTDVRDAAEGPRGDKFWNWIQDMVSQSPSRTVDDQVPSRTVNEQVVSSQ